MAAIEHSTMEAVIPEENPVNSSNDTYSLAKDNKLSVVVSSVSPTSASNQQSLKVAPSVAMSVSSLSSKQSDPISHQAIKLQPPSSIVESISISNVDFGSQPSLDYKSDSSTMQEQTSITVSSINTSSSGVETASSNFGNAAISLVKQRPTALSIPQSPGRGTILTASAISPKNRSTPITTHLVTSSIIKHVSPNALLRSPVGSVSMPTFVKNNTIINTSNAVFNNKTVSGVPMNLSNATTVVRNAVPAVHSSSDVGSVIANNTTVTTTTTTTTTSLSSTRYHLEQQQSSQQKVQHHIPHQHLQKQQLINQQKLQHQQPGRPHHSVLTPISPLHHYQRTSSGSNSSGGNGNGGTAYHITKVIPSNATASTTKIIAAEQHQRPQSRQIALHTYSNHRLVICVFNWLFFL